MIKITRQRVKRFAAILICAAAVVHSTAQAQSAALQEPDFSGLFTVGTTGVPPVMRDNERGWTYFAGTGSVEGVHFSQWLFRVNDAGIADGEWRLPGLFQTTDQYLAEDGTPIVRAYTYNNGQPTGTQKWFRLDRESVGLLKPVEITNTSDLPVRTSVSRDSTLGSLPLWLPRGNRQGYEVVVEQATEPNASVTYKLRKRNDATTVWERVLGGTPNHLTVDALGRLYVTGIAVQFGGITNNVVRFSPEGVLDPTFVPRIGSVEGNAIAVRALQDRIVFASAVAVTAPAGTSGRLVSLDLDTGQKLQDRLFSGYIAGISSDGFGFSSRADGRWVLVNSRYSDDRADVVSNTRVGGPAYIRVATRWRDGYVFGGDFSYWYDGKLYRNLIRVNLDFQPDPNWQPEISGTVSALEVDAQGRLLMATNSRGGDLARIVRYNADGTLDPSWSSTATGDVYRLLARSDGSVVVAGAFSSVNGVARNSLARFRADGALDGEWASEPTWPVMQAVRWGQFGRDGIYKLLDAMADGLFFSWEDGFMNGGEAGVLRVSNSGKGAVIPLNAHLGSFWRSPSTGIVYGVADAWQLSVGAQRGTALVRLLPPDMNVDSNWTTFAGEYGRQYFGIAYETDSHLYVCRDYSTFGLYRVDKQTGHEDVNWRSPDSFLCDPEFIDHRSDGSVLVSSRLTFGAYRQYKAGATNEHRNVIEYYSRDAKRFFMTGRLNEISTLDAMPASFVRTGMMFAAETATVVSSDPSTTAICRFYAPPAEGGSNTHFYGRGSDCVALKRYRGLRYEGFDFRASTPNGDGSCAAPATVPVYRLFNQRTSTNEGNHRYVVTEARKAEMISAGWRDEGIAFCVASASDSGALTDIVR